METDGVVFYLVFYSSNKNNVILVGSSRKYLFL